MDQSFRNKVISDYKSGAAPILIATDVAGALEKERDRERQRDRQKEIISVLM
jgi:superfamily II DNA/RNA helicase